MPNEHHERRFALMRPQRRGGASGPLIAVGAGVAAVAALDGTDRALQMYVPAVCFTLLWVWGSLRRQRRVAGSELYGVLAVASLGTAVLVPVGLVLGPITVMALGLSLLAVRVRDVWLAAGAVALLVAPVDVRGVVALFEGVESWRLGVQLAAAVILLGAGGWLWRRERRPARAADVVPLPH